MKILATALAVPTVLFAATIALPRKADAPLIGTRLPDFRATTMDGKAFHFYGLAGKKRSEERRVGKEC